MEETTTFFKRKEKKFLFGPEIFFKLKNILEDPNENFKTDHLNKNTKFTFIENIYFDSPCLKSYHESIKGDESRFKLRIRSYAQNYQKDDDCIYFEVKSKENGETIKKRVAFKSEWLGPFLKDGSYPQGDFVHFNLNIKPFKSLETLEFIMMLIRDLKYNPVLESNYVRYAFRLKGSRSIRITIDRDLKFNSLVKNLPILLPYREMIQKDQLVGEVKYLDDVQLSRLEKVMNILGEPDKFSKYCFGIYSSYQNGGNATPLLQTNFTELQNQFQ